MNIILIGMRGSGKTIIGKMLADKLNKDYLELDEMMVKKLGMSIPEIVNKHGWNYFRDQESEIAKEVSVLQNCVIATGGGVVVRDQNIVNLKKNGILILLKGSVQTLIKRIGEDLNRPALTDKGNLKEELEEVLRQREKLYEKAADEIIETDGLGEEEVVDGIISKLKSQNSKLQLKC